MSSCEHVGPTDDPCFRRSPPSISMESSIPFGEGRGGSVRDEEGALHQLHDEGFSLVLLRPRGLCHRRRSSSLSPRTLLV
ncbi:unnamed protein product, partial [Musa acuminata subsp. burmannicoides]